MFTKTYEKNSVLSENKEDLEGFACTYLLMNFFPQNIIGMHDKIRICKFFVAIYLFIHSTYLGTFTFIQF